MSAAAAPAGSTSKRLSPTNSSRISSPVASWPCPLRCRITWVAACAAASGLTALVLLRAGSGLFAGAVIPLMMAYLGDVVPYAERQATLGRFLTGMVMAQMLTGLVSGLIGERAGWRISFVALGLFSIGVGGALTARFGKRIWQASKTPDLATVPGPTAYLNLLMRPVGRWLLISAFFDGVCLFGGAFP